MQSSEQPSPQQRQDSQEWPAGGSALAAVQDELSAMRDYIIGKRGLYPQKGALDRLQEGQEKANAERLKDRAEYHARLDALPDTILQKLNGTYIKADDFPFVLAAALRARRSKRWQRVTGQGGKVAAGVLIIVLAAVFLALIHLANPSLP